MNDTTTQAKLRPEVKDKWLAALRSGEYQQGKSRLRILDDGGDRFCCLGVLCDLAVKDGLAVEVGTDLTGDGKAVARYGDSTAMPPRAVVDWAYGGDTPEPGTTWNVTAPELAEDGLSDDFDDESGEPYRDSLATLNDDAGLTFEQIADRIEAEL